MNHAIELSHITKDYGNNRGVFDVSFTVKTGEVFGFLGPNGAGKTTTMNIMTGCLSATDGSVKIDGYDIFEEAYMAKKLIGYHPPAAGIYPSGKRAGTDTGNGLFFRCPQDSEPAGIFAR